MNEIKAESVYRKNVVWNVVAGIINAAEAVIIVAVVSRVNGLKDAGILTFAFSVANLLMTVGKFGVRNYQVVHENEEYTFQEFLNFRMVTVGIMVLSTVVYTLYNLRIYDGVSQKMACVFWVCLWYAVEAFEDVYAGSFQARGRLDVGSKMFSIRWILTLLAFIMADFVSKDIVRSAICGFAVCFIAGSVFIIYTYFKYMDTNKGHAGKGMGMLFKESISLCIASYLYIYITSIPKYAINTYLGDETQAVYGYISMPVFVIALLNSFIYRPQYVLYSMEWKEHKIQQFSHRVMRQMLVLVAIVLVCLLGAFLLGIPVLSVLYHENLSAYKVHLLETLFASGFLAVGGFLANIFTVMDEQKRAMLIYLMVSLAGRVIIYKMVEQYQLEGAVWGYMITMILLAVVFGIAYMGILKKARHDRH